MKKRGEFKISLSNPSGGQILNFHLSGREPIGEEGGEERDGFVKRGGLVRLSAWSS